MRTIGQIVRSARENLPEGKITVTELAKRVGCSKQQISDIERDNKYGSPDTLKRIEQVLNVKGLRRRSPSLTAKMVMKAPPEKIQLIRWVLKASREELEAMKVAVQEQLS